YIMYTYQMQDMFNTCCFPSPSATQPSPIPPSYLHPGRPQADGSPLMCRGSAEGSFLTNREFFSCPCCHCACTKGVQALGSVKRLATIVLLWRYINKIELNRKTPL